MYKNIGSSMEEPMYFACYNTFIKINGGKNQMRNRIISALLGMALATSMLMGCGSDTSKNTAVSDPSVSTDLGSYDFSQDEKVILTAGGIQSAEDTVTLAMEKMAELASEKSGGTIQISVSPAAQLGDATSQMEAVSLGTQEIFVDASSWLSTFVDDALVTSMFFLFRDEDHFSQFLQSDIEKGFEDQLADKEGVRVIANNWQRSPRSIVCKKQINSLDDLAGMKMRVPDIKTYMESAGALGLGTAQVAWGETYLAIQQGVVDSCESPMDSIYTMKFYETTKHVVETEHIRDSVMVYMNESILGGLSTGQQQALKEAAQEAGEWYTEQVREASTECKKIMEDEGTVFDSPSEELIRSMAEAVAARAEELEKEGLWSEGLFAKIQAIGQ